MPESQSPMDIPEPFVCEGPDCLNFSVVADSLNWPPTVVQTRCTELKQRILHTNPDLLLESIVDMEECGIALEVREK